MIKRYKIKELKKLKIKELIDHIIYIYIKLDEKEVKNWKEKKKKTVKITIAG